MSLSRRRKRELKQLRAQAGSLLHEQREVLGQAGRLAQEARRQAQHLGSEQLAPRVHEAVAGTLPVVHRGVQAARRVQTVVRLLAAPILASALTSTIRGLDRHESRDALRYVQRLSTQQGDAVSPKKKRGVGKILAISLGVVAVGVAGYALWHTVRDDDELWVEAEG